ncbi:MAG: low specificity L-threonine aldolase [Bacteroidetes bacterium]|nr:MAG: low specificity L-threonine aldolase [Bacteroidota bacterium]
MKRSFASDNNAPVHPDIMQAIINANNDDFVSYGDDPYTLKAKNIFNKKFGVDVEVFFVCTGTGANVSAISHLIKPWQTVIAASTAHIHHDECGAPEKYTGSKLHTVNSLDGKLTVSQLKPFLHSVGFEHHAQPGIISITQSTELGMVYTPEEIEEIARFANQNDMYLHLDGARIANALTSLNISLEEMITHTGVDVMSFGATKNGLLMGEAVVFLNPELARGFQYVRKQSMQLVSKMRYVSAQFIAHFQDDLWLKTATHANQMARLLAEKIRHIPQVKLTMPVQTNAVFAAIPKEIIQPLQEKYYFYVWNPEMGEVRWMTHFNTTEEDIEDFVKCIEDLLETSNK